jgi:TetR/AcrR family transcriptional regulator, regulator of autoinduction and epiphytic fitness
LGRRELKKEATRQEILTAAAELFRTKGYEATSVDDIALAADVAKGTFYYHFQAKEDLVMALQEAELKTAAERARKRMTSGDPVMTILFDFLTDSAHWTEVNSDLARALFKQKFEMMARHDHSQEFRPSHGPPKFVKEYFFDMVTELLSAAQQSGEIRRDVEAAELTRVIIPIVMSARMHWLMDPSQDSLTQRLEKSLKIIMEGFKQSD